MLAAWLCVERESEVELGVDVCVRKGGNGHDENVGFRGLEVLWKTGLVERRACVRLGKQLQFCRVLSWCLFCVLLFSIASFIVQLLGTGATGVVVLSIPPPRPQQCMFFFCRTNCWNGNLSSGIFLKKISACGGSRVQSCCRENPVV